jgi:peptidoglycan hydrolase-like protein with peptidoglycan-binding domain
MLALPAAALAQDEASAASSPAPPAPVTPAPTSPTPAHMQIGLEGLRSKAPFIVVREPITVRGSVLPFVPGQRVRVSLYRDGHREAAKTVSVVRHGGAGKFQTSFANPLPGRVRVLAAHTPTAQMQALAAATQDVTVLAAGALTPAARGPAVWVLQRALGALHYAVPESGYFDEATADAVIAFRKLSGLALVSYADGSVFRALRRGEGAFRVRYPRDGRHVEADLSKQVLAEIAPHGRVQNIYPMSSGKPSTPTVTGHFRVYEKTPGFNSEMMLDSNYFISGYAIHGYPEVPTYAASHGCLRVPNLDAPSIYAWVQIGTPVDVY